MRATWACPDLPGTERKVGRHLLVPGSAHQFPECPSAYLRDVGELVAIRTRRGGRPFGAHLIDGHTHAGPMVGQVALEIRNGARTLDSLATKVQQLVSLHEAESAGRDEEDDRLREEDRRAGDKR